MAREGHTCTWAQVAATLSPAPAGPGSVHKQTSRAQQHRAHARSEPRSPMLHPSCGAVSWWVTLWQLRGVPTIQVTAYSAGLLTVWTLGFPVYPWPVAPHRRSECPKCRRGHRLRGQTWPRAMHLTEARWDLGWATQPWSLWPPGQLLPFPGGVRVP